MTSNENKLYNSSHFCQSLSFSLYLCLLCVVLSLSFFYIIPIFSFQLRIEFQSMDRGHQGVVTLKEMEQAVEHALVRRSIIKTVNTFCCVLLCHVLLCCIVLYCIVLYCIVLHCIVLCCIVFYCIVLYCIVLCCIVLYCTVLYCIILYCIGLYCAVLYCTVLY